MERLKGGFDEIFEILWEVIGDKFFDCSAKKIMDDGDKLKT